ncbi:MAG: DUF4350 domain-containing protein [Betaproteobacteria bacterium]|nr:DUF4350 domain-containing protein [Betaproteobacteria bacterium]
MTRRMFILPAIVLVLGGGALWLLSNMERVPQRVWVGYKGEARHNPWLAAERLLARMGLAAGRAKSIPDLKALPPDGTLVLPRRLAFINRDEQLKLVQWVEGGGHLIVEAEAPRQPDPLLDALSVARKPVNRKRGSAFVSAQLPGATAPLKVQMGEWLGLEAASPMFALKGAEATWLVHLQRGAGRVTAISELGFAGNAAIGKFDHAEFLWQLARLAPGRGAVSFFHSPQKLSLLEWLGENAWAAIAAAALLLAAWLWRVVPRFGPVAPDPEPARKRLLDHLRASGRFQWSSGGGAALAEAARDAALRRVMRAHPDFAALGAAEREARLAAQFGLAPEGVRKVLHPLRDASPEGLTAAASVYQTIHEQLSISKGRR